MEHLQLYIALLAALVVGLFLIRKITGCLVRIFITLVVLAIISWRHEKTLSVNAAWSLGWGFPAKSFGQ